MNHDMPYKTVPCMYCGLPTMMTGTKKCNGCWEVDRNLKEFAQSDIGKKRLLEVLGVEKPDYVVILPFDSQPELESHMKAYMAFLRQLDLKVDQQPTLVTEELLRRTTLEPGLPVEVLAALRTLRINIPQFNKMRETWTWVDFATEMEGRGEPEFSAWDTLACYVRKHSEPPVHLRPDLFSEADLDELHEANKKGEGLLKHEPKQVPTISADEFLAIAQRSC